MKVKNIKLEHTKSKYLDLIFDDKRFVLDDRIDTLAYFYREQKNILTDDHNDPQDDHKYKEILTNEERRESWQIKITAHGWKQIHVVKKFESK